MIDKIKEFLGNALCVIIVFLPLILLVLYFVVYFYALFEYGGRPVSEIPTWAWWLLQNRGGK